MSQKHPLAVWREAQVPPVTQNELAVRVGTSRWMINRIENGERKPGRQLLLNIARETANAVGLEELAA